MGTTDVNNINLSTAFHTHTQILGTLVWQKWVNDIILLAKTIFLHGDCCHDHAHLDLWWGAPTSQIVYIIKFLLTCN